MIWFYVLWFCAWFFVFLPVWLIYGLIELIKAIFRAARNLGAGPVQ